jgi:uncharacterized glyoxalase superfamily protein PhnB
MIKHARHVIAVADLARSAAFYRDMLGFAVVDTGNAGWRFFVKDQCFIMAGACPDALAPAALGEHAYFAYLDVDDVDAWHARLMAQGVACVKPLRTEVWGMREFGIRTVDGHRIMFGSPAPP